MKRREARGFAMGDLPGWPRESRLFNG